MLLTFVAGPSSEASFSVAIRTSRTSASGMNRPRTISATSTATLNAISRLLLQKFARENEAAAAKQQHFAPFSVHERCGDFLVSAIRANRLNSPRTLPFTIT